MSFVLADRVLRLKASASLEAQEKVARLAAAGVKVVDLTIGEPCIDTAPHIVSAVNFEHKGRFANQLFEYAYVKLYALRHGATAALPAALKRRVEGLEGLHVRPGTGRSRDAVTAGETPHPLAPHEGSQRQPVARFHPITGKPALYLCESGQMDWVEGPFVGMEPGPHGDGARLIDELMSHLTQPKFIYVHEWNPGDLVAWDNRCLVHAATWFDAARLERVMWRTTVQVTRARSTLVNARAGSLSRKMRPPPGEAGGYV